MQNLFCRQDGVYHNCWKGDLNSEPFTIHNMLLFFPGNIVVRSDTNAEEVIFNRDTLGNMKLAKENMTGEDFKEFDKIQTHYFLFKDMFSAKFFHTEDDKDRYYEFSGRAFSTELILDINERYFDYFDPDPRLKIKNHYRQLKFQFYEFPVKYP